MGERAIVLKPGDAEKVGPYLQRKTPVIYLWSVPGQNVGHFVYLNYLPNDAVVEFFDPLGHNYGWDTLRPYVQEALRPRRILFNHHGFESPHDGVETCGDWCVLRAKYKRMPLADFTRFIQAQSMHKKLTPDEISVLLSRQN